MKRETVKSPLKTYNDNLKVAQQENALLHSVVSIEDQEDKKTQKLTLPSILDYQRSITVTKSRSQ